MAKIIAIINLIQILFYLESGCFRSVVDLTMKILRKYSDQWRQKVI